MKKITLILAIIGFAAFIYSCGKSSVSSDFGGNLGGTSTGKAGSMAKFSIVNDHLYLINDSSLLVYTIQNEQNPEQVNELKVGFGIETVFSLGGKLFIGSNSGVYIYDVTNPLNILFLSHYEHIVSCDPVVANDTIAFATLNSFSNCRWQTGANQLDVINIKNIVYPVNMQTIPLEDPKGLAINDNYVFVCNGMYGVKIYDFSNPYNLQQVSGISGIDSYDAIINDNILYLIGKDGLFQYDCEDVYQIIPLSNILF